MLKNKDIIVLGYQSWDTTIGSNCKNIALELAKHNRVLYVNLPIDRKNHLKRTHNTMQLKRIAVLKGILEPLEVVSKNLWTLYPKTTYESVNWIKNSMVFNFFNRLNSRRLANEIKPAISKLNFQDFILFNDSDMFRGVYLKELLSPTLSIYYIRDYLISQPYFKKHGIKTEAATIKNADVVVTNSPFLRDYALSFNKAAYYVGQGCDLSLNKTNNLPIPKDMEALTGIKIGYVGYLTQLRLDISLLAALARLRPDWRIVLVGPEDSVFANSPLHQIHNVHFLGKKSIEELPNYIENFDVCINPQLVNDLTIGNYPRKIDEYLSMGKVTIATKTPTMHIFESVVYLGSNANDYIDLIEKALQEDCLEKQQERIAFAQSHTWENNVKEIEKAILEATKKD